MRYHWLAVTVQVGIVVGKEGFCVALGEIVRVTAVLKADEGLLFHGLADVLDRVAAPHLSFLDHSTGRHY